MKLISMTDFVLTKDSTYIFKYANFLKQPLELWMFIPCNDNGVVLEEPKTDFKYLKGSVGYDEVKEYNQAKERVLFEGFTFKEIKTSYEHYYIVNNDKITWLSWNKSKTVENLLDYNQEIKLTPTAIKQLGL